jgi:hypothetical protein
MKYKAPKIIALEIEEFDEESGVDAIALVESPAIESDFFYFKSQLQKDNFNGEMEIDVYGYTTQYFYMCPGAVATFLDYKEIQVDEETQGMIRSAAQIADNVFRIEHKVITEGDAELEELGEAQVLVDDFYDLIREIDNILGTTTDVSYMEGHLEVIRGYIDELVLEYLIETEFEKQELNEEEESAILEHLSGLGETEEELRAQGWVKIDEGQEFTISSTPTLPSIEDKDNRIYRYKYSGPVDSKNRSFCSRLMRMNKLYRKEDINQMTITGENSQFAQKGSFTYDIFKYAGGKYCRHKWVKVPFKKEDIKSQFSEIKNEKQLIAGPLMIPRK